MVTGLFVGVWASVAPRSFLLDFPGLVGLPGPRAHWAATDGRYNEHLARDVGDLNLALAVLSGCAVVWLTRPLTVATASARLVHSAPRFASHALNLQAVSPDDRVAELGSLASPILVAAVVVAVVRADPGAAAGRETPEVTREERADQPA